MDKVTGREVLARLCCVLAAKPKLASLRYGRDLAPRHCNAHLPDRFFHETVRRQENLAVVRDASDLYKSTDKKRSCKRNPGTKEMTDSICHAKIT